LARLAVTKTMATTGGVILMVAAMQRTLVIAPMPGLSVCSWDLDVRAFGTVWLRAGRQSSRMPALADAIIIHHGVDQFGQQKFA